MRNIYIFTIIIIGAFLLSSCDDFLDKQPTNYTNAKKSISTVKDAEVMMNGIMRSLGDASLYGCNLLIYADAKGGDYTVPSMGNGWDGLFTFNHSASAGSNSGFWSQGYFCIMLLNSFIENVEELEAAGGTGYTFYRGQAYTLRALIYFELTRLYGSPYNYKKEAYGVPEILKTMPANAQPLRATVAENYKHIISDLQTGKEALSGDKKAKNAFISYWANRAIEARVKLFMDDYDGAFSAAKEIIDDGPYSLYANTNWASSWGKQFGTESIFEVAMYVGEADQRTGSLAYITARPYTLSTTQSISYYVASDYFLNRLGEDPTDIRWGVMDYDHTTSDNSRFGSSYKYAGGLALSGDGKGSISAVNIKVIRLSEIYLIAAEAALNKSSKDAKLAADYLNEIRKRAPGLAAATETTISNDMILDERSKELFGEGHRFFDLIRKNKTITFHDLFYNATRPTTRENTIDRTFNKTILPISQAEINANPPIGEQQNPGY